jgi:hypothetical protein
MLLLTFKVHPVEAAVDEERTLERQASPPFIVRFCSCRQLHLKLVVVRGEVTVEKLRTTEVGTLPGTVVELAVIKYGVCLM